MSTTYKVTTDGKTYEGIGCLSGHGIIEVDPIDATTAIVTVAGNGAMFEQHAATCDAIIAYEEIQLVTPEFAAWLDITSFAGQVEPGEQWDTVEAWPSTETLRAARECFRHFHAGDLAAAETAMHAAQQPFV